MILAGASGSCSGKGDDHLGLWDSCGRLNDSSLARFEVAHRGDCFRIYPEGVMEQSPGLAAQRPTLGKQRDSRLRSLSGNGRALGFRFPDREHFREGPAVTQGRLLRRQPWAKLRNPVGVNAKNHSMRHFKKRQRGIDRCCLADASGE